jgi:hypothetical protein
MTLMPRYPSLAEARREQLSNVSEDRIEAYQNVFHRIAKLFVKFDEISGERCVYSLA